MTLKLKPTLPSIARYLASGLSALLLADILDKGLFNIDWINTGRVMLNFTAIGILRALITYLKPENGNATRTPPMDSP